MASFICNVPFNREANVKLLTKRPLKLEPKIFIVDFTFTKMYNAAQVLLHVSVLLVIERKGLEPYLSVAKLTIKSGRIVRL